MNVELRCRLTQGDIGPFPVARTLTVLGVKEQLLRRWPQEGPLRSEQPNSAADLKLIMGGKFLDNNDLLEDVLASHFGEGSVVTLHVVVRPATPGRATGKVSEKQGQQGCLCSLM